ncbi:MAG TPA: DUF4232 domain-containing protein, partial [Mycobacteriales bacterium]|nr:DUF4232 domain-containing protein [Mycobacteriales bacterium]
SGPDCSLQGHPTVTFTRADGSRVPVQVSQGGYDLPEEPATPVALTRDTSVSFRVGTGRSGGCQETARITAELPGTGGPLTADTYLTVCGGRAGVTPVHRSGGDH